MSQESKESAGSRIPLISLFLCVLCACASSESGPRRGRMDMSEEVRLSEKSALESDTLSSLAALERSLNDFIQAKKRIPKTLDELVPRYLADIPTVTLGMPKHTDNNKVKYYPPKTIMDGQINGAALRDTGSWGYVYNDHQVIVFVDCTHKSMSGRLWYQARGVY